MRHCSSVVDVDTRRSFEGPFSEAAWSTVHCWRRSRRLALATVNLGASECNTSLRWDVTPDSIPNISPPRRPAHPWTAGLVCIQHGDLLTQSCALFLSLRPCPQDQSLVDERDYGATKTEETTDTAKCRNWARSDWTPAVDGGQSSDGYSRVTHCPLPGRAWPHRRRLDGWAAGMGSVHMSLVSALTILDRPSSFAQQGRLST